MKKIIVFGSNGGLGKEICNLLKHHSISSINKTKLNFNKPKNKNKLFKLLKKLNPDVIINSAGFLGSNKLNYTKVFDVNFGSNWNILRYYLFNNSVKKRKIILIGSSAYKKGKKDYMLYSASKSALHNLFLSAHAVLKKKNIELNIFHPSTIKTRMISKLKYTKNKKKNSPIKVAKQIINSYKLK